MMLQNSLDTYRSTDFRNVAVPQLPTARRIKKRKAQQSRRAVNRITPYLAQSVASELELMQQAECRFGKKRKLLQAYNDDCDRLQDISAQVQRLFSNCIFSSLIYGGTQSQNRQGIENTLLNATELLAQSINVPLAPQPIETDAHLIATSDVRQLHANVLKSLEDACYTLVDNILAAFRIGVDNFIFGLVENVVKGETFDDDAASAARYCYFTRRVRDSYRQSQTIEAAQGAIDTALHVHDVVDARLVPLPARQVAKPKWIPPLFDAVPEVFKRVPGGVSVLTGNITLERVSIRRAAEDEYRLNRYPMHCDPALLIANTFVLTGWNPTDIRSRTPLRQWTPDALEKSGPWHESSPVVQYRRRVLDRPSIPDLSSAWKVGQ